MIESCLQMMYRQPYPLSQPNMQIPMDGARGSQQPSSGDVSGVRVTQQPSMTGFGPPILGYGPPWTQLPVPGYGPPWMSQPNGYGPPWISGPSIPGFQQQSPSGRRVHSHESANEFAEAAVNCVVRDGNNMEEA